MSPKVSTKFLKEALETISKASTKNIKFTSMKNSANLSLDRVAGIRNRVFTGDPIFPKDVWQIPAFNTNSAYRLTGQSQINDIIQTGFVRPRSGKIKGGHTNEVHWSAGNAKSGYNINPGQYILESPRGLVDGTSNAIGVNDLSHVWTTRNGQVVDVIDEIRPHMRTVSSPLSSKRAYTWFERPSTYFKDATYAGTPGTYAGKEVPTWQLPKGQRNQSHNPTATERIYSVLGRDPNIPTEGVRDFTTSSFTENQLQSLYKFLQQHGVDTKNITLSDLENLYGRRFNAIKSASNNNYNLAVPQGQEALPRQWEIRTFDPEGLVGEMMITGPTRKHPDMLPEAWEKYQRFRPGSSVDMVRNATRADGASMYHPKYGWYATEIPTRTPVSGVSQRMYDAGIPTAQQTNNGRGLMSGEIYLQPQRSTAVMEHYPTKQIIRNNGEWHWENLDPTKVTTRDNPVYLLTQPSGRYIHIPTKSTLFFPSAIKNGQITTNINHGSIFLEDGGKL